MKSPEPNAASAPRCKANLEVVAAVLVVAAGCAGGIWRQSRLTLTDKGGSTALIPGGKVSQGAGLGPRTVVRRSERVSPHVSERLLEAGNSGTQRRVEPDYPETNAHQEERRHRANDRNAGPCRGDRKPGERNKIAMKENLLPYSDHVQIDPSAERTRRRSNEIPHE